MCVWVCAFVCVLPILYTRIFSVSGINSKRNSKNCQCPHKNGDRFQSTYTAICVCLHVLSILYIHSFSTMNTMYMCVFVCASHSCMCVCVCLCFPFFSRSIRMSTLRYNIDVALLYHSYVWVWAQESPLDLFPNLSECPHCAMISMWRCFIIHMYESPLDVCPNLSECPHCAMISMWRCFMIHMYEYESCGHRSPL